MSTLTGRQLLDELRLGDPDRWLRQLGPTASPTADTVDRPAALATLLTSYRPTDRTLVQELTRYETAYVAQHPDIGCGDALLACCWLLFRIGVVEDVALVWAAKRLNFDTFSYIDSVLLVPAGAAATIAFATETGRTDLATYVAEPWQVDVDQAIAERRSEPFLTGVPEPSESITALAAWMRL